MNFMINCGGCPELIFDRDDVGNEWYCTKRKEHRHNRRELCEEVWEAEVARLVSILKDAGSAVIETVEVLDRGLNPRLALEKIGAEWPPEPKPEPAAPSRKKKRSKNTSSTFHEEG